MKQLYRDFGSWIRTYFDSPVQKISVNAGFTCPNRDGKLSTGGCTYCDNRAFNPSYCDPRKTIKEQLEDGKAFFSRKYHSMKYLAYFQAYTNTYASVESLKRMYEEALMVDDIVGIVIGTRPDCMSDQLLNYLELLDKQTFLLIEYGVETTNNDTLQRIHRGHTFECSKATIEKTHDRGILTGAHVIIGLPGESAEDSIAQAPIISSLPIDVLKIHQMQVIRHTLLAKQYAEASFHTYTADQYLDVIIRYIERLRNDLVLERFVSMSPPDRIIAPKWGLKPYEWMSLLIQRMIERNTWQGKLWHPSTYLPMDVE